MNPLVSIIIVNWNGRTELNDCLDSLGSQAYKPTEIIIWDNNSSDDSKTVANKYKSVRFIVNSHNFGFAEANTLALKRVSGKYVLLLNNDTKVSNEFLKPLIDILERQKDVGVVQPMLLFSGNAHYKDGTANSLGAYLTPTGFLYYPRFGKDPYRKELKPSFIYAAYGACMLIRKSLIDRIGLFDKDFFAYFEETDFCHRVWLAGSKVMCEPKSVVYHRGSSTSSRYGVEEIIFHSYKNRICSYLKNLDRQSMLRILPAQLILNLLMSFVYIVMGKPGFFLSVARAFWWNVSNLRNTLAKRAFIQSQLRVKPDAEFMPEVLRKPIWKYYYHLIATPEKFDDSLSD